MSRRGRNSADNIDFDFFDEGPSGSASQQNRPSNSKALRTNASSHSDRNAESNQRSTSRSDSEESNTRQSVKIAATVPRVEVEDDSDSSSNSRKGKTKEPAPGNSKAGGRTSDRSRSTSRSSTSRSRSASASSTDSASTANSSSQGTGADSDMTDVSPLHSPKEKHKPHTKKRVGINDTVYDMESKQPRTANRSRPASGKSTSSNGSAFDKLMEADKDTLNLDLLMQAIMEMEEDRNETHKKIAQQGVQNPTSLNRKNLSFSNDRVKEIDKENQRLMRNILKHATIVKKQKKQPAKKSKPVVANHAPSEVNRMREQKRIEQENFALLRRLNAAKADPTLQRDKQLDNFNNSKLYGVPMKAFHPSGDGLKSCSYSSLDANYSTHRSRPSSATAIGVRPPSAKLTGNRPTSAKLTGSRPTSAKLTGSRPASAKLTSGRPTSAKSDRPTSSTYVERPLSGKQKLRPAWDERW